MAKDDFPPVMLAEWPRSNREVFRITLHPFQGRAVVSIRAWYRNGQGEFCPARDGVSFGLAHLAPMLDALAEAYRLACQSGFIPPEA